MNKMKIYLLVCFIALSQLNFGAINLKLRSVENFKTNKAVNYKCRELTIQGGDENDTLFVNLFDTLSFQKNINFINIPNALALMETASFYAVPIAIGRHKRYSVQQETAPDYFTYFKYSSEFSEHCLPRSSK